MSLSQFLKDHNVPYVTEGANCSPGWINVQCPYCDDPSEHMGINLKTAHCNCWRCGWRPLLPTLQRLTGLNYAYLRELLNTYHIFTPEYAQEEPTQPKNKIPLKSLTLPTCMEPITELVPHSQYLLKRNFDPAILERDWYITGTNLVSKLKMNDKILNYSLRIIIPFIWEGQMVSFTSRDITGRQIRYKSCPKELEIVPHKQILYGRQDLWKDKTTGICVEGAFDVWRLGFDAFSTSGIEYTPSQIRQMARYFKRVIVIYDNEPQAQRQAYRLIKELQFRKVKTENIICPAKDPASLSPEQAQQLLKQII